MPAGHSDPGVATSRGGVREWLPAIAAVVGMIAVVSVRKLASWDVWWHLAIGREATRSAGTVPFDTFSYSFHGAPYVHKDLVADVLFYRIFDGIGFAGIALIEAVALGAAVAGLRVALGDRARPLVWLAVCAAFLAAVQSRVIPRPLVFTIGFFPLMLGLLERARRVAPMDVRSFGVAMVPVVALQWLWLNLHRGGLIGLVLLLGFALSLALQSLMHRAAPLARIAGPRPTVATIVGGFTAFAAAAVAGLVNVSGAGLYRSGLAVTHDPIHRSFISEWQPLTAELAITVHPFATALVGIAWSMLVVALVGAVRGRPGARPSVDVWHVGVLALFTYQGIQSMRWLSYASAAAAVIVALAATDVLSTLRERETARGLPALLALIGAITLASTNAHPFGLGPAPNRYPAGALVAADVLELGPNVHNTFVYGGYVAWASEGRRKVLIDGRNDMLYPSDFFLRCSRAQHDIQLFADLWTELEGDWVLADNTPGRETFRFLGGHPDWMAVYWSEEAVIYVLRQARPDLAQAALRFVSPGDPVGSLLRSVRAANGDPERLADIGRELDRLRAESPDGVRTNTLLALYLDALGPGFRDRRDAVLEHLRLVAPDHPAVTELRSRMLSD